jgi:hypothetical protein
MANTKVINIHDAKIKTVNVGIKAMTINDRQVTLAVFRQLVEERLIHNDGSLAGLPWGFVNYHPDGCKDERHEHRHVVWQKGDELRRAVVYTQTEFPAFRSVIADCYATAVARDAWAGRRRFKVGEMPELPEWTFPRGWPVEFVASLYPPARCLGRLWNKERLVDLSRINDGYDFAHDWGFDDGDSGGCCVHAVNRAMTLLEDIPTADDLSGALREELIAERERRDRWLKTTQEIMTLPQLFVAV